MTVLTDAAADGTVAGTDALCVEAAVGAVLGAAAMAAAAGTGPALGVWTKALPVLEAWSGESKSYRKSLHPEQKIAAPQVRAPRSPPRSA